MHIRTVLIAGVVFLNSPCGFAQSSINSQPSQKSSATQQALSKQHLEKLYASLNAPWADDDRPYQNIRSSIEKALAQGQSTAALLQQYETPARRQPHDAKALFGWGYAAYWAATAPSTISESQAHQELGDVYLAIGRIQVPHTFNYARLRFLNIACIVPDQELTPIGKRMLQHDPNDYDVKYYLASVLSVSRVPTDRQQSVAYAQDLIRQHPSMPSVYSLLGSIYYEAWHRDKRKEDAEQSVAAYRHYLQLAPPTYHREQAKLLIAQMQKPT